MTDQLPVVKVGNLNFDSINTTVGLITPEIAAQLLERNFANNRNVSSDTVRRYSRLMKDGRWKISDPIKFSNKGILIDGQHRLNAVIHSGESVPFVIIAGYPREVVELLDQGMKRDARHIMQFRGMSINPQSISTMRHTIDMCNPSHSITFSPSEIVSLIEVYSEGLTFASRQSGCPTAIKYAPVLSVILMAYYVENHERLEDFLYCWHTGTVRRGTEDNAAILLRNYYLQNTEKGSSGGEVRRRFFYKTQSALSYFLKGDCPKYIKESKKIVWSESMFDAKKLIQDIQDFESKSK